MFLIKIAYFVFLHSISFRTFHLCKCNQIFTCLTLFSYLFLFSFKSSFYVFLLCHFECCYVYCCFVVIVDFFVGSSHLRANLWNFSRIRFNFRYSFSTLCQFFDRTFIVSIDYFVIVKMVCFKTRLQYFYSHEN